MAKTRTSPDAHPEPREAAARDGDVNMRWVPLGHSSLLTDGEYGSACVNFQ
jgi:hypothetical protein